MKKNLILAICISGLVFQNCKTGDIEPEENELITTLILTFKENSTTAKFSWKDLDGDGGNAPIVDEIKLKPNTSYEVDVEFLDESKSPAKSITDEIKSESDEHLIVLSSNPLSLFTYTYLDKDLNNLPIGLNGQIKTNSAGVGSLKLQLRHQPPINGKKSKDGTVNPGSDDVNVDFNVSIK